MFGISYLQITVGAMGVAMAIWGSQTRGTLSRNISIIGGLLWFTVLIWVFVNHFVNGLYFLLGSFVLGAILKTIFPKK